MIAAGGPVINDPVVSTFGLPDLAVGIDAVSTMSMPVMRAKDPQDLLPS